MNLDNFFNLSFEDQTDDDENSLLFDFSEHPIYWISGYKKVINNHLFFKKYTNKIYKDIAPEVKIEDLEKVSEEFLFRKAWEYIKPFDLSKNFHLECLKLRAEEDLVKCLNEGVLFFEALEEYEKCALLKGIKDKTEEFLK